MSKSSLRKDRETTVTTNLSIAFNETTVIGGSVTETGSRIYVVPRKGEAILKRVHWTYRIEADPLDGSYVFALLDHGPDDSTVDIQEVDLVRNSLVSAYQTWRILTNVGLVQTAKSIDVDLGDQVLSRRTNLQSDDDFSIVPAYFSGNTATVGQSGAIDIKERLFQAIFRDDLDEWSDYTFEESAS